MGAEAASTRRNKRVVRYTIRGFKTAKDAIIFGNTVNAVVQGKVSDFIKFKLQIGSPNTKLAITEDWKDETVLRLAFLEVKDQNTAMFIVDRVKSSMDNHEKVHGVALETIDATVREKPQPQYMTR